jgi:hypothetical protein
MSPSGVRAARWTSGLESESVHAPPPFVDLAATPDAWEQARSFLKDDVWALRLLERMSTRSGTGRSLVGAYIWFELYEPHKDA